MTSVRPILYLGALIILSGCSPRTARVLPAALKSQASNDYIDIQPGWRLTVVTPILKSGGFVLKTQDKTITGNAITFSAGTDFEGYEIAHYQVKGRRGGRVRVEFSSAEVTKSGRMEPQPHSVAPLFQLARRPYYIRLIYLTRISQADHNMAVVGASQMDVLEVLTRQALANPANGCKVDRESFCSWIPEGISVRPETLRAVEGVQKWVDAPR